MPGGGKCISTTHELIGSARVIPICIAQRQATETAAGKAALEGLTVRETRVEKMQDTLVSEGDEICRDELSVDPSTHQY